MFNSEFNLTLGNGNAFTAQVSIKHIKTQAEMIQKFLNCKIVFEANNQICKVSVKI